jgi:hypothetical protein
LSLGPLSPSFKNASSRSDIDTLLTPNLAELKVLIRRVVEEASA